MSRMQMYLLAAGGFLIGGSIGGWVAGTVPYFSYILAGAFLVLAGFPKKP